MDSTDARLDNLERSMIALQEAVKLHARILQGDKSLDVPPLMDRLSELQKTIGEIHDQWVAIRIWAAVFAVSLVVALAGIFLLLLN